MNYEDYKWKMLCLDCTAMYLYHEYPPYSSCFNCGSKAVEVRKLG
jgi:rRNA maturation endonuclease Nob1